MRFFVKMKTHGLYAFAIFFTALFRSSLWCARRKIGRDKEIWRSGDALASTGDQISRRVGMSFLASRMISCRILYSNEWRPRANDTYTCATNWPSTCGVVRIRPWWCAGLSIGPGTTKDEEIGGSFLATAY